MTQQGGEGIETLQTHRMPAIFPCLGHRLLHISVENGITGEALWKICSHHTQGTLTKALAFHNISNPHRAG
ncbi:hypothetical protein KP509_1Z142700 [Ceratopteris richardii]|nr:hypothetical protein KP509_1Z142700 [Ceratopteris richardii]